MLGTLTNSLDFSSTGYEISSCLLFHLKLFLAKLRGLSKISFSEFFNHQPDNESDLDRSSLRFHSNCFMSVNGDASEIKFDPRNTFIQLAGINFKFKEWNGTQLGTLIKNGFKFQVGQLLSFGGNNQEIDHLYILMVIFGGEERVLLVGEECKREVAELKERKVKEKLKGFIETAENITVNQRKDLYLFFSFTHFQIFSSPSNCNSSIL